MEIKKSTQKKLNSWLNKQIDSCYNCAVDIDNIYVANGANSYIHLTYDTFKIFADINNWTVIEQSRGGDYPIELSTIVDGKGVKIICLLDNTELEDWENGKKNKN